MRALLGLAGAVVVVAAVLAAVLVLAASLWRRVRPGPAGETVLRRCDACGRGWQARPGVELSLLGLRVRRWWRRRLRRDDLEAPLPSWCRPQGWSRCPTCLSRRVRTTGEAPTAVAWTARETTGVLVLLAGAAVLTLAAAGLLL